MSDWRQRSFVKITAIFVGWLIAACGLMAAPPAWQAELTPTVPGPFPPLPPVVLDLEVSWNGMLRAGTIRMEFSPVGVKKVGRQIVRSSAVSQGAAGLLFPYQSNFWSEINPSTLLPDYFHAIESDDKERVESTLRYFPSRVENRDITRALPKGAAVTSDNVFRFGPVYDMFSAMLHVRSQKLADGDKITQVVDPFGTPYLLRVNVVKHEIHNGRKAIRLRLGMLKIDRKSLALKPYKKLKQDATLWLSDDADRVPVELRAAAFIGDVRATLVRMHKP